MKQNIYDNVKFYEQYTAIRSHRYTYNNLLEQPHMQAMLPNVQGKRVLDIGCGAGDFAAYCMAQGAAEVVALDISANMIHEAKKRHSHMNIQFIRHAFEDYTPAAPFDVIVSSLAFHYIADYEALIAKIAASLTAGGTLLFSTEHPNATAHLHGDGWLQDENGNRIQGIVDHYQQQGQRERNWLVDGVIMYHRTMATLVNTLIQQQLQLEQLCEPMPTAEAIAAKPSIAKELMCPGFLIIRAKKV